MIPIMLLQGLKESIQLAVKEYRMHTETTLAPIKVYIQHISNENLTKEECYPLIVITLQKIDDDNSEKLNGNGSLATIGLTFGFYGVEESAWQDLLNVMEHCRQWFLKHRTIKNKFRLILPLKWEVLEVQPYPFWFGYATLQYTVAQPVEEVIWK